MYMIKDCKMLPRVLHYQLQKQSKEFVRSIHSSNVLLSSSEREYLHETKIPTYHFQKSLPRLPVPELDKTCQRYLNSQKPLTSAAEYKDLEKIVSEFQGGHGIELHKELVEIDKQNKQTSYVTDLWFDMYLRDRRPLVLTHNPFLTFHDDPRPEYNTQILKAANMLVSSSRCMKTLRDEKMEPEVFHLNPKKSNTKSFRNFTRLLPKSLSWYGAYLFKAFPLDMSQYGRLFNSTRIPRPEKDELFTDKFAKHVAVMRSGHFYIFDMLNTDGNIIAESEVLAHLSYILADTRAPPEFPISFLTSENRDVWTNAREQLLATDPANGEQLNLVDSAMFVMCLDEYSPNSFTDMGNNFLYGDGVNRWYDKSFQLMIDQNGSAGLQFEHAWGDGVAVMRYLNEVHADITQRPRVHPDTPVSTNSQSELKVRKLEFTLNDSLKQTIQSARNRFMDVTQSLDAQFLKYEGLTKNDVRTAKLSPDSVMQLSIQLAHYRMYGRNAGTYESCSTSAFKHGRTETVRPCTTATNAMCEKLYGGGSPQGSVEELQQGLQECSKLHSQLTKDAAMGQGFDRHLLYLKHLSQKKGLDLAMFNNSAYQRINHIILSTSTLSAPSVLIGGFAAVTPDGFGIGYTIENDRCGFNVTAYPACSVPDFLSAAEHSLNDIRDIIQGKKPECKQL